MGDRVRHDAEIERAVLGALLIEPKAWAAVAPVFGDPARLSREHFTGSARQTIFDVIQALQRRSAVIDYLAIRSELRELGDESAADEIVTCAKAPFRLLGLRSLVNRLEVLRDRRESRGKPKGEAANA